MVSETSKHRHLVLPYLHGNGLDLGCGGDPVIPTAIGVDLPPAEAEAYTTTRFGDGVHWAGDATDLSWLRDRCADFVFSSHLLEDFHEWRRVLTEWMRVVKSGGYLVLLVPEQGRWAQAVEAGQPMNHHHAHEFLVGELSEFVGAQYGWVVELEQLAAPGMETGVGTPDYSILFVSRRIT